MSWSIDPFVGRSDDLGDYDFTAVAGSATHEINDRENEIIEAVKDGIEGIVEATGGHLSISAYGSQSQIPSPGDTTVIYITYVPDPSQSGGVAASPASGSAEATMTTQEALNQQAAESQENDGVAGPSEGLLVGDQVQGDIPAVEAEETVAVIDPADLSTPSQGTPTTEPAPSVPPQLAVPEQPIAPVDPSAIPTPTDGAPVDVPATGEIAAPIAPVDPTLPAPSLTPDQLAAQSPSAPTNTSDGSTPSPADLSAVPVAPDSMSGSSGSPVVVPSADSPSAPPADIPATPSADPSAVAPVVPPSPLMTTPDGSPADAQGAGVDPAPVITQQPAAQVRSLETGAGAGPDDASARVAAQVAENPVDPKPLYWADAGTQIDASERPQANVLAANGALLYNYASDQPGGAPTGAPDGSPWHVYEGATQPAPGTPEAAVAAAQQQPPTDAPTPSA